MSTREIPARVGASVVSSFVRFLESKFGFWLATTLLVGLATISYAFLQTHFEERLRREILVEKLDLEVEFRLSQYMSILDDMSDGRDRDLRLKEGVTPDDVRHVTQLLIGEPGSYRGHQIYSMYPEELGNRPMASLLVELASLRPERAPHYKDQIAALGGGALLEVDFNNVFEVASLVNKTLIAGTASGEYLYFTDCPPSSPLC